MNISPTNAVATMINVFTVELANQQQLIETWLMEAHATLFESREEAKIP